MREISEADIELLYSQEKQIYEPVSKRKMTTFKELSATPKSQSLHAMRTVCNYEPIDMDYF